MLFTACVHAGCRGQETQTAVKSVDLTFTDVTKQTDLANFRHENGATGDRWFPEAMGGGAGFVDLDGDEWIDIVLVGGGTFQQDADDKTQKLWAFKNKGGTSFEQVDVFGPGTNLTGIGFGISAADVDNDGDEDIFLTTLGKNHLLENRSGTFVNISDEAGLGREREWSTSAMFFDANSDGHLDLYVGNYVRWSPEEDLFCSPDGTLKGYCTPELYTGVAGRFYINNGDRTFTDATTTNGFVTDKGKNLGVVALDYNDDGWVDVAIANDTDPDMLYRNEGNGVFTESGVTSGMAFDERGRARAGMGIDVGVVDDTGEESIFVGNFSNQMIGVYRHLNDGVFLDRAATSQVGRTSMLTLTFGLFLFDVDLDGDLDLFAANGHVQPYIEMVKDNVTYRQPSHLFINDGLGQFEDQAPIIGGVLADSLVSRAAAFADYDNDGDLDVLVTENGGPAHLWRNETTGANYVQVSLEGENSNRDGVGSKISLHAGETVQVRRVRTGSSFLSQSELRVTFGLGIKTSVDSVVVDWPSGFRSAVTDVEVNTHLVIAEAN